MNTDLTELQSFGLFGIYKESFKLIFSFKKIFSQLTLPLTLPLAFLFLAQFHIAELIFGNTVAEADECSVNIICAVALLFVDHLASVWALYWLFRALYLIFYIILSLLSTSAFVYTIACIYTAKPITFNKVMSVVPKVWKRLLITFFWNFIILIAYNAAMAVLLVLWNISIRNSTPGLVVVIILVILYLIGLVYVCVVWELASVVSVLEELYGLKAMKKGKVLIKGKLFAAGFIFLVMEIFLIGIEIVIESFVVGDSVDILYRVMIGIGCFLLTLVVMLLGIVTQTVIYFVCKSCHHENIDKSGLADHLEGYVGEYIRLGERKHLQLEQVNV